MFLPISMSRWLAVASIVACTTMASAEGTVLIDDFEGYAGGTGSWTGTSNGIDVNLSLIEVGAIEGNNSLQTTLDLATLGGAYSVSNTTLNLPVPPGIENLEFKYRSILGLNLSKTFTVTLTDQNNQTYISSPVSLTGLSLNVTHDFSLPLANFSPPATGGAITSVKSINIAFTSSVISVAGIEQLDSLKFTWDDSGVSYDPHQLLVDFGTRVSGPNSNFDFVVKADPADVDIAKFSFRVAYNSDQVNLTGVTNNTGQVGSTVNYTVEPPQALAGYPNFNTYQTISLTASPALITPENLAQLNFTATAQYNDPNNRVWIMLLENPPVSPLQDENWNPIPVTFEVPSTPVPVSLSAFTIE